MLGSVFQDIGWEPFAQNHQGSAYLKPSCSDTILDLNQILWGIGMLGVCVLTRPQMIVMCPQIWDLQI